MMKNGTLWMVAALVACGIMMACQGKDIEVKPISGTIEEAFGLESASTEVREAMAYVELDERYEKTFEDTKENVEVWSLMRLCEERSSEGMGVVVVKDGQATAFPDIRHGNNPSARYDAETQTLWLACGEMEGTGIFVQRLYQLHINEDGSANIVQSIDPYDMQQALLQRLSYNIEGQSISFYDKKKLLCCVTDTVSDMGGFDEEPVWIGEQLSYDLSDETIRVRCLPGLKYVTGLVLSYDVMPTIVADVEMSGTSSFTIDNIKIKD